MKKILSLVFIVLITGFSLAQKSYTISGTIVEKQSRQPIEYATITLENQAKKGKLIGIISDKNGHFSLEAPQGKYELKVSFFSFKEYIQPNFIVNKSTDLGVITLSEDATELEAVEVIAQRSSVEMRLDKKIYNVGTDMTVKGGSITDVLSNVPSVSVDLEGNISLRGSENVKILINGKPSALSGMDNQTLQQLPAESIEKIEVITNPSSRYQAQGSSGIINIILKKGSGSGFTGSASANVGVPNNYGTSINLNYRKNNWTVFNTTSFRHRENPRTMRFEQTFLNSDKTPKEYQNEWRDASQNRENFTTNLGIEYLFNKTTSITGNFIFNTKHQKGKTLTNYQNFTPNKDTISTRNRTIETKGGGNNLQYSVNFIKKFNDKGHQLTADYQYSTNTENKEEDANEYLNPTKDNTLINSEKNTTDEDVKLHLIQMDYVLPIDKNMQFEAGYRSNFTLSNIDYKLYNQSVLDDKLSNNFIYKEKIHAVYAQIGAKINQWNASLGLRGEYTDTESLLLNTNETHYNNYFKLFPSVFIGYTFSNDIQMNVSYTKRLQRPMSRMLNPFVSRTGRSNLFSGNPNLNPTFTNSYEWSILKRWDKVTLNSSLYYRHTTDVFSFIQIETGESISIQDKNGQVSNIPIALRKPINLATENSYGLEITTTYTPAQNWKIMWDLNLFNKDVIGSYSYQNSSKETVNQSLNSNDFSWFSRLNIKVALPYQIDMQTLAMYIGPQKDAQSHRKGMFSADIAFSKDVLNRKGTISLSINDILNSKKMISDTQTTSLFTHSQMQWRQRQILLNFIYRFGGSKTSNKKNTKRTASDSSPSLEEMAF